MSYTLIIDATKFIIPSTVLIGAVGWLTRSLIVHFLNKDVAASKVKIEHEANRQFELYKSQLDLERNKLQTRYSGIFSKQAAAILSLYQDLEDFSRKADFSLGSAGTNPSVKEEFRISYYGFKDNYSKTRIFLPYDIDNLYKNFFSQMFTNVWVYSRYEEGMLSLPDDKFEKIWEKQKKALDIVQIELPKIKSELIQKFRLLLGIEAKEQ
jgi:hypothetical protein